MNAGWCHRCALALLIAGMLALVTGCMVGPDYTRPAANVPAAYRSAAGAPTSTASTLPEAAPWWTIYHDAKLDALVAKVAVDNQSLKAAAARTREADALLAAARGERVPAVSVGTFNVGHRNRKDFGLAVSWEVDLWGRIRRNVQARGADAEASADDLAAARLSMQAEVVQGYFALREKDATIHALEQLVASDGRWLAMVHKQYGQGIVASTAVAAAHARLSKVDLQLADARIARAKIEHAIAVLLGQPPEDFSLAPAPFDTAIPVIPAGVPSALLQRRPDIAAAERRMAAASARIGVRVAETYPELNLVAGVGVLHGLFATPEVKASVYAGGALRANVAHARAAYDEAVANYRQTVLDSFREVEDSLVTQNLLASAAAAQHAAVAAARKSAQVVDNQYREGVVGYQAVVEAKAAAFESDNAGLQLHLQRLDATIALVKATGGGWRVEPSYRKQPVGDSGSASAGTSSDGNR